MNDERRIFLVNKLIDVGLLPWEQDELDELQSQPWEPSREPPIDVKNEVRMADLINLQVEDAWIYPGYVVDAKDVEKLMHGSDPKTIGPKGIARRYDIEDK